MKKNQEEIIKAAELRITEAINKNQRVIIASDQDVSQQGTKDGNGWKILIAVLPVLLTVGLGYWIWNLQKATEKKISESDELLKTGLAIKQEFYKNKLVIYEKNHQLMYELLESLQNAQVDPDSRSAAIESLRIMYQAYSSRSLYMNNAVIEELQQLWTLGTDLPALRPNGKSEMKEIVRKIAHIEQLMREDLHVLEIGQVSELVKKDPQ
jgi:hypothetical protein